MYPAQSARLSGVPQRAPRGREANIFLQKSWRNGGLGTAFQVSENGTQVATAET